MSSGDKWQVRPGEMVEVEGTDRLKIKPVATLIGNFARASLPFSVFQLSSRRPNEPIKSKQTMQSVCLFVCCGTI
jgi:hypothetical protein